mmetsp:Transcript_25942/g.42506  ORF Transcript_25942/g.42506 Transcript_25942/m.42506 type:complete len:86 (-) Transcript_25942:198-455(-)
MIILKVDTCMQTDIIVSDRASKDSSVWDSWRVTSETNIIAAKSRVSSVTSFFNPAMSPGSKFAHACVPIISIILQLVLSDVSSSG